MIKIHFNPLAFHDPMILYTKYFLQYLSNFLLLFCAAYEVALVNKLFSIYVFNK